MKKTTRIVDINKHKNESRKNAKVLLIVLRGKSGHGHR